MRELRQFGERTLKSTVKILEINFNGNQLENTSTTEIQSSNNVAYTPPNSTVPTVGKENATFKLPFILQAVTLVLDSSGSFIYVLVELITFLLLVEI